MYGDEACFDASASFLSLPVCGSAEKAQTEKADNELYYWTFIQHKYAGKLIEILSDFSRRNDVFAFSTAENRLCRTQVRRRDDFRRFCIFFISPRLVSAKQMLIENHTCVFLLSHSIFFSPIVYRKERRGPIAFYKLIFGIQLNKKDFSQKKSAV